MRGMDATKAEAEKRAAALKFKGAFAMGTMWMPCANERALMNADARAYAAVTGQMIAVDSGQHLAWRTPDIAPKND